VQRNAGDGFSMTPPLKFNAGDHADVPDWAAYDRAVEQGLFEERITVADVERERREDRGGICQSMSPVE
jgi:hypothetical protein